MFGSLSVAGPLSGEVRYSCHGSVGIAVCQNAPPFGQLDLTTGIALAAELMSKSTPVAYAFPRWSNVPAGSLQASLVWPSFRMNCQNGGGAVPTLPHVWPWLNEKSKPQWLKPMTESFCPATTLSKSRGFTPTHSSACRRSPQSWLTRMFLT